MSSLSGTRKIARAGPATARTTARKKNSIAEKPERPRTPLTTSNSFSKKKKKNRTRAPMPTFFLSFFFFHLERLDKRWQRERESRARCSRAARFFSPSLSLSLSLSLFSSLHSTTPEKTGRAPPPRLGPGPVPPPLHAGHDSGKRR